MTPTTPKGARAALGLLVVLGVTAIWFGSTRNPHAPRAGSAPSAIERAVPRTDDQQLPPQLVELPPTPRTTPTRDTLPLPPSPAPATPVPRPLPPPDVASAARPAIPPPPSPRRADRLARRRAAERPALRADLAADSALRWLVAQQHEDGHWSANGLEENQALDGDETEARRETTDLRVTTLALLALLEDGHSPTHGAYRDAARRAADWIVLQQDTDTGSIGTRAGLGGSLDHAFATFALGEVLATGESKAFRVAYDAALLELAERRTEDAPLVAERNGRDAEPVDRRWRESVAELAAFHDPASRRAMQVKGCNTLHWRYVLHAAFVGGNDAHDVFARFTFGTLRASRDFEIQRKTNDLLRKQIVESETAGAFESRDARHRPIGRVGVTALHVICLAIVADRLDETHDAERWDR